MCKIIRSWLHKLVGNIMINSIVTIVLWITCNFTIIHQDSNLHMRSVCISRKRDRVQSSCETNQNKSACTPLSFERGAQQHQSNKGGDAKAPPPLPSGQNSTSQCWKSEALSPPLAHLSYSTLSEMSAMKWNEIRIQTCRFLTDLARQTRICKLIRY